MRILHVIPGLTHERGGPSAVVEALVRHQIGQGHVVTVLTTDQGARSGERPVELASRATVERLPVRGPDRVAFAPAFRCRVRQRLGSADIVHVHSIFTYPVHVTLSEALAARVPVVLRPCGLLHRYSLQFSNWRKRSYLKLFGRQVRRACTAWHYTSANEAAESWPGDTSPRFIVPNGIDPDAFGINRHEATSAVGREWPALRDVPYALFLGRLHPKKRLDLLLEAFLSGAPAQFKLAVAGPDECGLWEDIASRFARNSAGDRIVRIGMVQGFRKSVLLAGASLFALPSEHENFGIAALEALASGVPVLVSPHVDLAGDVDLRDAIVTAPIDVAIWRNQLARLLNQDAQLRHKAEEVAQKVRQRFSWEHLSATIVQHYQRILHVGTGTYPILNSRDCATSGSVPRP